MTDQLNLFDQRPEPPEPSGILEQALQPIALHKDRPGLTLADLVPENAVLELNRSYPTRVNYVNTILRRFQEISAEGRAFNRDGVAAELSIAAVRFESTTGVMRRAELIEHKSAPTPLGGLVLSHTPYLDDIGLLWLLHYLLASNANLVLWSHFFNQALIGRDEVSIADATAQYTFLAGRWSARTLAEKAPKELGGIIRTYSEEMFAPLGLLVQREKGIYDVLRDTTAIPPLIWLACLLVYRDRYYSGAASLETPLIVDAHFSPGRILRQREAPVRRALDELHNAGLLAVETRSGLDQVRFRREFTWLAAVQRYFEERAAR